MRLLLLLCVLLAYVPAFGADQSVPATAARSTVKAVNTAQKGTVQVAKPGTARSVKAEASAKRVRRSPSPQSDTDDLSYCAAGCGG